MVGRERKGTEPPEEKSYWGKAARECDSCRTTPALFFCRAHSAFLCGPCDTFFHASTTIVVPHERVPMCEVCEQAPAAFTCKADAATLCVTCDADIHSANPLAQRHDRAHVLPLFQSPTRDVNSDVDPNVAAVDFFLKLTDDYEVEEMERASKRKIKGDGLDHNEYHLSAVDPFLELDHQYVCSSMTETENPKFHHAVGVVDAVQDRSVRPQPPPVRHDLDDFTNLNQTAYSNYVSPLSHSVSSEVGKVSEGSTAMDMTPDSHEQYWSTEKQTAVERVGRGMDREARLMRYREKRRNRKFQKTIRYASRKAYAETRPRVKGRFVKRKELGGNADAGVADSIYASSAAAVAALMVDPEYGVVPSF